jgi:hypothetical protein
MRSILMTAFFGAFILEALSAAHPAQAAKLWSWHYSEGDISANGTLTTDDAPNSAGFYRITGITGSRNGVAITGLQPTGTPIPGNEPYPVDNLIRAGNPQLTSDGFGFGLADGTFANAFFGESHSPKSYLEFFSSPARKADGPGAGQNESPVVFSAEQQP